MTTKLEPHPHSKLFPAMDKDDFLKLVEDIRENELHHPIIRYQGMILDGNNRYKACLQLKIEPTFADFEGDDAQAKAYVISANIHRRHLDLETRKNILRELLKLDPSKSDRQLGEESKLDHKTVGAERAQMVDGGEIPHQETTVGKDGVPQPKKKKKSSKPRSGGEQDTCKYPKVTNASTALKAYGIFEQHLLDVLEDVADKSDFSQADELAQKTIENLQDKLTEMQPQAEAAE
jgi:ParB-like chromosome segregation protein Spo0J